MEVKIFSCIIITNIVHDFAEPFHVIRQLSVGYVVADQVTENTAEIFVPGKRQEAAGIRKHADEAA